VIETVGLKGANSMLAKSLCMEGEGTTDVNLVRNGLSYRVEPPPLINQLHWNVLHIFTDFFFNVIM